MYIQIIFSTEVSELTTETEQIRVRTQLSFIVLV